MQKSFKENKKKIIFQSLQSNLSNQTLQKPILARTGLVTLQRAPATQRAVLPSRSLPPARASGRS